MQNLQLGHIHRKTRRLRHRRIFLLRLYACASYYFTDMIGENLETGFPAFLKAGVFFKF